MISILESLGIVFSCRNIGNIYLNIKHRIKRVIITEDL